MKTQILQILNYLSTKKLKESSEIFQQNHFANLLSLQIKEQIGAFKGLTLRIGFTKFEKALLLARKAQYNQAEQAFSEGDSFKKMLQSKTDIALLDVFELPAVSYLHYKKQDYAQAEKLLWDAIENDTYLEENGFPILIGHRIQQIHNIARIYFKQGDFDKGCELIKASLNFLFLGEALDFGGEWSFESLKNYMPQKLKSVMEWQLATETIYLIHQYRPDDFFYYFQIIFSDLEKAQVMAEEEQWQLDWIKLQKNYYQKDYTTFLEGIIPLADRIDVNYTIYLYSLLSNIMNISETIGLQVEQSLLTKIQENLRIPSFSRHRSLA